MEKTLTPAPIDQRNVLEDALLEGIFDNGEYIPRPLDNDTPNIHQSVGYINNQPYIVLVQFGSNELTIIAHFPQSYKEKSYIDNLLDNLCEGNIFCEHKYISDNGSEYYEVRFYFKDK